MDHSHSTIASHIKGKHLSYEERVLIQIHLKDHYSIRAIAREIGCSPSTVSNEIARGSVALYNGHVTRYKASSGQKAYEDNRKHSCRHYDFLSRSVFLEYVFKHFTEDGWSLDAYYAHPYTSCDKGTVERHNGLIRRFVPKGKRIDDFTGQQISDVETWCNCLPRKVLGYRIPDEIFEEEIDRIYQATA